MEQEREFEARYAAARSGQSSAQDWILKRFSARLAEYVVASCGSAVRRRESPEDIAQEAAGRFLDKLPGYPADLDESAVLARLLQHAKWKIADVVRGPERPRRESSMEGDGAWTPAADVPSAGTVTRADELAHLGELIALMAKGQREVLELCALRGLGFEEAAAELGSTSEAVRKRYERATLELQRLASSWRSREAGEP